METSLSSLVDKSMAYGLVDGAFVKQNKQRLMPNALKLGLLPSFAELWGTSSIGRGGRGLESSLAHFDPRIERDLPSNVWSCGGARRSR